MAALPLSSISSAFRRCFLRLALALLGTALSARAGNTILVDRAATPLERFAAREIQRYVYQRCGPLLEIRAGDPPEPGDAIVVASDAHGWAAAHGGRALRAQQCRLLTEDLPGGGRRLWILGGDDIGALYGAYRFAEHLGVRFYLTQDVVPEGRIPWRIPELDETRRPLFPVRGLQPFHDFAEGPDWWNADDYLAIEGQMAKLGLNFIGLHTYPDGETGPEPTVWIGRRGEYDARGNAAAAYPASYQTTERGGRTWWNYAPLPTSAFDGGAAQLYDRDNYGADAMGRRSFSQQSPPDSIEVFNRTAAMLRTAFVQAHRLGILTCVGTETPLILPRAVKARARAAGLDLARPDWARPFYTAIFERIGRAYPLDYYWLWTPESWTWEGNRPEDFAATADDIKSALAALRDLHSPITLATCGWVLGPQQDRTALDRLLPLACPMSAINRAVGYDPIDRQFADLRDRPHWAIPWLENDGALTSPELWAGRMRFDAADALRLGCTGLIGIHWRTRILAPNVAALAAAAWDQSWVPPGFDRAPLPRPPEDRTMPLQDFYDDFARANFGSNVAERVGAIFRSIDGTKLPRPSVWVDGPGDILRNPRDWSDVAPAYAFVGRLEELRPEVRGAANLDRYDYWLNQFRAFRTLGELGCLAGALDRMAATIQSPGEPPKERDRLARAALAVRLRLARRWEDLMRYEIAGAETSGELGTIANLEQRSRAHQHFLDRDDAVLERALGRPLPPEAAPSPQFTGSPRIFVPTIRRSAAAGESVRVRAILVSRRGATEAVLRWRPLGTDAYASVPLRHVARAVWEAELPPLSEARPAIEYHLEATLDGRARRWPVSDDGSDLIVTLF